ncbi:MAG: LamG domain-containing protein [Bacteroidetes bacterium]|nr:LamG domain-containing protein [Bacteroidota bacterium]
MSVSFDSKFIKIGATISGSSLLTGLLAYWKLDEASGNVADSANSHTGTATALTYSQAGSGGNGTGVSFNGTTSKIVVGAPLVTPTAAVSISFWIKTTSAANTRLYYTHAANEGIIIYYNGGWLSVLFGNGTTESEIELGGSTIANNAWHLIVIDWDGTNMHSWVDDTLRTAATAWTGPILYTDVTNLTIGDNDYGSGFFTGILNDIGVWNRALTSDERTALYAAGSGITHPFS